MIIIFIVFLVAIYDVKISNYKLNLWEEFLLKKSNPFKENDLTASVIILLNAHYKTIAWIYKAWTNDGLITLENDYFPQTTRHFLAGDSEQDFKNKLGGIWSVRKLPF